MEILIENIGKVQDKYLESLNKGNEIWLCERNLEKILNQVFPNYEIIKNRRFNLSDKSYIVPDYLIEDKKLIIEFQGYQHFTNPEVVYKDSIKKIKIEEMGYNCIQIPYFIQMTISVVEYLFGKYVDGKGVIRDYSEGFPHGFIHPKSKSFGEFCYNGLILSREILNLYPEEIRNDCIKSLEIRSWYLGIPLEVLNPIIFS